MIQYWSQSWEVANCQVKPGSTCKLSAGLVARWVHVWCRVRPSCSFFGLIRFCNLDRIAWVWVWSGSIRATNFDGFVYRLALEAK